MQTITTLEHAQRILRQREVHPAQIQQLLEYLLRMHVETRERFKSVEALLLTSLEFTRLVIAHIEKTGHAADDDLKTSLERAVNAMKEAQRLIKPEPRKSTPGEESPADQ
jgi:hypothetical protein